MKSNKKGFTLVEILIAMALVAILVAIMSPNIARIRPDKEKALFIKAYTRTEIAVVNMINDTEMYPTTYDENGQLKTFGLCSTAAPIGLLGKTESKSGTDKFAYYFAKQLGSSNSGGTIKTNDGITYNVEFKNANSKQTDAEAARITVSLDGKTIGSIKVKNGGNVECGDANSNACQTYMNDRYDLKIKD